MGSATREALAAGRAALSGVRGADGLAVGENLFQAARALGDSAQLRAALADPAADPEAKATLVAAVFADMPTGARDLLTALVSNRWSNQDELLAGIEEIGIRAVASSAPQGTSIEDELFAFSNAVTGNAELELAVGSKLGSLDAKGSLVNALLSGSSAQTRAIVEQVVRQPRGRRIGQVLAHVASIVADDAGLRIATVVTAAPLTPAQLARLTTGLARAYGQDLKVNQVIDPSIVGGVRVQIGDDVIDGTVATRLTDLRLALAG